MRACFRLLRNVTMNGIMSGRAAPSRAARTEQPRCPVTARLYPTGLSTPRSDVKSKRRNQ